MIRAPLADPGRWLSPPVAIARSAACRGWRRERVARADGRRRRPAGHRRYRHRRGSRSRSRPSSRSSTTPPSTLAAPASSRPSRSISAAGSRRGAPRAVWRAPIRRSPWPGEATVTATRALQAERNRALTAAGRRDPGGLGAGGARVREAELALQKAQRDLGPDADRGAVRRGGHRPHRAGGRLVTPAIPSSRLTALCARAGRGPGAGSRGIRRAVGAEATVEAPGVSGPEPGSVRASPVIDPASGTREVVLQLAPGRQAAAGQRRHRALGTVTRRVVAVPREAIGRGLRGGVGCRAGGRSGR